MKTKKTLFERKGSLVTYHRERHSVPCPCLTPEGFRDPIFHRDWRDKGMKQVDIVNTGTLFPASTTVIRYWFFINAVSDSGSIPVGPSNIYASTYSEAQPFGLRFSFNNIIADQSNGFIVFRQIVINGVDGPLQNLGVHSTDSNKQWLDTVPINGGVTVLGITDPDAVFVTCNQLGFVSDPVHILLRAFVQPQWGARRTRQYLLENFGELRTDDHIGMFPMSWNGHPITFENWSDAGDEYVEYANQRFTVVGWTLIPDPRSIEHGPHHWEVVLRRIKGNDVAVVI